MVADDRFTLQFDLDTGPGERSLRELLRTAANEANRIAAQFGSGRRDLPVGGAGQIRVPNAAGGEQRTVRFGQVASLDQNRRVIEAFNRAVIREAEQFGNIADPLQARVLQVARSLDPLLGPGRRGLAGARPVEVARLPVNSDRTIVDTPSCSRQTPPPRATPEARVPCAGDRGKRRRRRRTAAR